MTVNADQGGSVELTLFDEGRNAVVLIAIPHDKYLFKNWEGLPVGAPNAEITHFSLVGNINVSVTFGLDGRKPDQAEETGMEEPLLTTLVGEYVDENGTVDLIIRPEGDRYHVEIGIYRLTYLDDVEGWFDGEKLYSQHRRENLVGKLLKRMKGLMLYLQIQHGRIYREEIHSVTTVDICSGLDQIHMGGAY